MDPLSAAFAAYLDTISTTVTQRMQAQKNLDVQAHVVQHNGHANSYAHRMWKVQDRNTPDTRRRKAEACATYQELKEQPPVGKP